MRHLGILITFLLLCGSSFSYSSALQNKPNANKNGLVITDTLKQGDDFFAENNYKDAVLIYKEVISKHTEDGTYALKKVALSYAALNEAEESVNYIKDYLKRDFNPTILNNTGFDAIRNSQEFNQINDKFTPKLSIWAFIYLYVALIGFYIATIVNFNKKIDRFAKGLVSVFIFIHSIFILHIALNMTNYHYQFPHSYNMSTLFSFLYGPLLYLYFKRITQQYRFKKIDLLHLVPTFVLLIVLVPTYALSADEKLSLLIDRSTIGRSFIDLSIIVVKFLSLMIYGYFIRRVYIKSKHNKDLSKINRVWQRNLYAIHFAYIGCYAAYGLILSSGMTFGFLYHLQVALMALMVMYIGYSANVQPSVFSGSFVLSDKYFFKYEKSGLTHSLSEELKNNLLELFDKDKIYKENNINLELLAERLNTTRHNASQVINEHFKMNFHELINKYRINEAKNIFDQDYQRNLNIIDVAYEVGYNNKVTFNKAFKKDTNLTPSEYQRIAISTNM